MSAKERMQKRKEDQTRKEIERLTKAAADAKNNYNKAKDMMNQQFYASASSKNMNFNGSQ